MIWNISVSNKQLRIEEDTQYIEFKLLVIATSLDKKAKKQKTVGCLVPKAVVLNML